MDILCFGSATKDVFVQISPRIFGKNICFYPGTKTEIEKLQSFSGGGATNTSVGFSRLGLKAGIVSATGFDFEAKEILLELRKEKVHTAAFFMDKSIKTARSVILTGFGRDRVVLTYSNALQNLLEKNLHWKKLKAKWYYISSLHSNPKKAKKIIEFANKKGIKVAFNPGGVEIKAGLSSLKILLKKIDVLILNSSEALALTKSASIEKNLFELQKFCDTVVITDGKKGSFAKSNGKTFFQKAFKVKPFDVTGAGDAFGCAFVASLINGKKIDFALKAGTANASSVIKYLGTKNILLNQVKLNQSIKKGR